MPNPLSCTCESNKCVHGTTPRRRAPRRTLARPAGETPLISSPPPIRQAIGNADCVVVVIDTGVATPATVIPVASPADRINAQKVHNGTAPKPAAIAGIVAGAVSLPANQPITICRAGDWDDEDVDLDRFLGPYSGHGTFIAGLVNRIAPNATIVSHRAMPSAGDVDDFHVGLAIDQVLVRLGRYPAAILKETNPSCDLGGLHDVPVIINLSFSGYAEDNDPPLCTQAAVNRAISLQNQPVEELGYQYREKGDVIIVASAGNNADCRITWPAGFDHVNAIGALNGSAPAWFTNYGKWVNACAQGVEIVSNFYDTPMPPAAASRYREASDFNGWATWSGTSFAAPIVAATLAQEVLTTGATPRVAVERLIEPPELFRLEYLGTVINTY